MKRVVQLRGAGEAIPFAALPKGNDILHPVSENADHDILIADRVCPSPEQRAAQKGVKRCEILIVSYLTGMENDVGAVILCNLTGYVECVGIAVTNLFEGSMTGNPPFCIPALGALQPSSPASARPRRHRPTLAKVEGRSKGCKGL